MSKRVLTLITVALFAIPPMVRAADVTVMSSGGFFSTLQALVPGYEKATGNHVIIISGPSMGDTVDAIPKRLARGETDDVLVMVGSALDGLLKSGAAAAGSRVDVALSPVGVAVRAGAPVPDISTVDKLRAALLNAKSIAYSDSASGVYIQTKMFKMLGIEDQVKDKAHMIPATPVGEIVAKGEAEIGFQQVAELLPVKGITFVGPLPSEVQLVTVYAAGLSAKSPEPAAGRALIEYLASPAAAALLVKNGLQPPAS